MERGGRPDSIHPGTDRRRPAAGAGRTRPDTGPGPSDVARAALEWAAVDASYPEYRVWALAELSRVTKERDDEGRWIVGALHKWGQLVTHAREPAGAGGEFLMHPHDVASLKLGDCDDLLRAQAGMAAALGLPVAALVWDYGQGGGHVSTIVGLHSYASGAVLVIDRQLPVPAALGEFRRSGGAFSDMAAFEVIHYVSR